MVLKTGKAISKEQICPVCSFGGANIQAHMEGSLFRRSCPACDVTWDSWLRVQPQETNSPSNTLRHQLRSTGGAP